MATDTPADPVHGGEAGRWGGWSWRSPRRGDHFRTCSYCGSIHPEDLAAELIPAAKCLGCGGEGLGGHYRNVIAPAVRHGVETGGLKAGDLTGDESRRLEVPEHSYDPGGAYASWADQKYGWPHKFYVHGLRPRDPALLHCLGHAYGERRPEDALDWTAAGDLTREQKKIIAEDGMLLSGEEHSGWYAFRPKKELFAKFYTVHLADPGVPAGAKEKIAQASGVRFHFEDGRVRWHGVMVPCEEAHP